MSCHDRQDDGPSSRDWILVVTFLTAASWGLVMGFALALTRAM